MQSLYTTIFYNPEVNRLFSDEAVLGSMLSFESALAQAQAKHGIISREAALVIEQCCRVENINREQLIADAALGGNTAIPLIKQLTSVVKQKDAPAAKYVHFGATSQDVIDTALMLQVKKAVHIIGEDLDRLALQLVLLIEKHRVTLMIGRSFMQQARPITFGYKVAGWLDALLRSVTEIKGLAEHGFPLQFGGAVGTLSGMNEKGLQVSETMSGLLQLNHPVKPWHTERDYVARIATTLGILTGNIGKIAKDISLLMQTEIAEIMEPAGEGKGGSSTMPHKRNPVGCIAILANAARVPALVSTILSCMVQDGERATGLWHGEWETLASLVQLTAGCVYKGVEITNGLEIRKEQMLHNLERTNGLIYAESVSLALADKIGKAGAHELMEQSCEKAIQQGMHLKDLLLSHPVVTQHLSAGELEKLFDPAGSIGLCEELIQRVLNKNATNPK